MCLAFRASGLWLCNATLQNLISSFPWMASPTPSTLAQSKERKGSNFAIWQHWWRIIVPAWGFPVSRSFQGVDWPRNLSFKWPPSIHNLSVGGPRASWLLLQQMNGQVILTCGSCNLCAFATFYSDYTYMDVMLRGCLYFASDFVTHLSLPNYVSHIYY